MYVEMQCKTMQWNGTQCNAIYLDQLHAVVTNALHRRMDLFIGSLLDRNWRSSVSGEGMFNKSSPCSKGAWSPTKNLGKNCITCLYKCLIGPCTPYKGHKGDKRRASCKWSMCGGPLGTILHRHVCTSCPCGKMSLRKDRTSKKRKWRGHSTGHALHHATEYIHTFVKDLFIHSSL